MILVTQIDGTAVALNVDRIERIEHNALSREQGSNVFFVGGAHLVVEESQDILVGLVLEAKARVQARGHVLANDRDGFQDRGGNRPTGTPPLRMVPNPEAPL
jgi:uncharacterized protein YlzI (FlbEa/FlbD family)